MWEKVLCDFLSGIRSKWSEKEKLRRRRKYINREKNAAGDERGAEIEAKPGMILRVFERAFQNITIDKMMNVLNNLKAGTRNK